MDIICSPMKPEDYGVVESVHWRSQQEVRDYIRSQGLASMLAFDGDACVGQLYVKEYSPSFENGIRSTWNGDRPWADFRAVEPLGLDGRWLTLGCFHVGWEYQGTGQDLDRNSAPPIDGSLLGRGIGTKLLASTVDWFRGQTAIRGLVAWALAPDHDVLQWAGQMPYTVYQRFGFRIVKDFEDPDWARWYASPGNSGGQNLALKRVVTLQ